MQRLLITHDQTKLIVVHTARQVAGQDRYGVAMIGIASKQLLPVEHQPVGGQPAVRRRHPARLRRRHLARRLLLRGHQRLRRRPPADQRHRDGLPGRRPTGRADDVKTNWITRCFDSIYSVAISEKAVYIGGHFAWNESPTAPDPWPGLDDVGYGTGQGLSGYGLGDAVVNREHLGALNPVDGKALEWNPGSNSYEGNKAMEVTPRGLFTGGDATTQAGSNIGRIAFFDFNSVPASNGIETAITEPIDGHVNPVAEQFNVKGTASVTTGTINRVELRVFDRGRQPLPGRQPDHVADRVEHDQHHAAEHRRPYGELDPAADHHRQPQAAAAGPDVLVGRHR